MESRDRVSPGGPVVATPYKMAKNNLDPNGLSPTMVLVWDFIKGDQHVGDEVVISINAMVVGLKKSRPVVTRAVNMLVVRGFLRDLTQDPSTNKPHHYAVLKGRAPVVGGAE